MGIWKGIISKFLKISGYLVPLVQSLPTLGVWTGLMTLPFASYLIIMLTNLPINLTVALQEFFTPYMLVEKALILLGFLMLVYSLAHLRLKKKEGLVISGPYSLVRHPQYLGILLSTLGFTSWSVWILNSTFGIGFLSSTQTIAVWFVELFAYITLAFIEELFLSKIYGESFEKYKDQVPFLVPIPITKRRILNIIASVLILSILLFILTEHVFPFP